MKNVNGKEDTAFTVQYDFCMPDRFNLTYVGEDGKEHRAFVVHRSSIGAIERIMAFLIEHYAGKFPTWLSPLQVAIVPVKEAHEESAAKLASELRRAMVRTEVIANGDSLGKRIHKAKTINTPYIIVLGDKEVSSGKLTIEKRDGTKIEISAEEFQQNIVEEIKNRS
jgi:threonyl-tRNA synthetase